jgi:alpha/beta superfamily hydrolase
VTEEVYDHVRFSESAPSLAIALKRPTSPSLWAPPGIIVIHGFPTAVGGGANSFITYPFFAERIAEASGATVLAVSLRGMPDSEGEFSPQGWIDDVGGAIDWLANDDRVDLIRLIGFGTGGAICLHAAVGRDIVSGVITAGAPADLHPWTDDPASLRGVAALMGIVGEDADLDGWAEALGRLTAERSAAELGDKDLLVLHGSSDHSVPPLSARAIADAHGSADLRMLEGGSHHLRHDPRAVAIISGWLERRQRVEP